MLDFEIQRCTRHCAGSDRELQPGEVFFSVLVPEGATVVRRDYSAAAWPGPPAESVGWWKSQMPEAHARKMSWAPHEVMLQLLEELDQRPAAADLRYVLALLMVRRRIVKLQESQLDEDNRELLQLYCPGNETTYEVLVATPTPQRIEEIQNELARLLFAEAG